MTEDLIAVGLRNIEKVNRCTECGEEFETESEGLLHYINQHYEGEE